jgi:dynactin complex subunit
MVEATIEEVDSVIGQRVESQGKFGSIRYLGKLTNNPKAGDDLWLGIEWDEEGQGKHNGTVDGFKYF